MYDTIDSINATNDVSEIFVYANQLTGGWLSPLILASFFLVAFLGSFFMQVRLSGRGKFDISFASAGFVTVGLAVLMSLKNGLIDTVYLGIAIGIAILGVVWLFMSEPTPQY